MATFVESPAAALQNPAAIASMRDALLAWYRRHRRNLPWRRTSDPYAIWVSEVMLQQTRVAAVLEHYARWMKRFPTTLSLAEAEEPEVLAHWSGLGYYRRARFLHAGARAVVAEHGGRLPSRVEELKRLPGIGDYTSAAIASIAFGEAVAVLDGNVERVLLRVGGPATMPEQRERVAAQRERAAAQRERVTELRERAAALLSPDHPGDHNQAMMELGATVCLPRAPLCLSCPLEPWCQTRGEHPVTPRKAARASTLHYALVEREHAGGIEIFLMQRATTESLMPGMWELPQAIAPETTALVLTVRHSITVNNYTVHVYRSGEPETTAPGTWTRIEHLPQLPLTGLARKVLKRLELWP
jgi:A/G-specific adenine glycosylase